jgi:hypothetical protein
VIETTAGRPRFASDKSFQLESEEAYNPWVRAIGVGVVGTALYATHRTMLATVPEYAPTLQNWAQKFENQTPFHIGRTFAFTERLSSYTTPEELKFTRSMLTNLDGSLNTVGETFQRQFKAAGVDFDVLQQVTEGNPLLFKGRRRAGSAYMKLVGRDGIDFETRFTPSEGRLAGTASRLGRDLHQPPLHWSTNPNFRERMWENFQTYRSSQRITNASPWREAAKDASDPKFRPFHSRAHVEGNLGEEAAQTARNVWSRFQVESLEAVERPQRLFAEAGFGLKAGTWNKTFHLPFAGEGGFPDIHRNTLCTNADYRRQHNCPGNGCLCECIHHSRRFPDYFFRFQHVRDEGLTYLYWYGYGANRDHCLQRQHAFGRGNRGLLRLHQLRQQYRHQRFRYPERHRQQPHDRVPGHRIWQHDGHRLPLFEGMVRQLHGQLFRRSSGRHKPYHCLRHYTYLHQHPGHLQHQDGHQSHDRYSRDDQPQSHAEQYPRLLERSLAPWHWPHPYLRAHQLHHQHHCGDLGCGPDRVDHLLLHLRLRQLLNGWLY